MMSQREYLEMTIALAQEIRTRVPKIESYEAMLLAKEIVHEIATDNRTLFISAAKGNPFAREKEAMSNELPLVLSEPATEKQIGYMKNLGLTTEGTITKDQARELIKAKLKEMDEK